MENLRIRIQEWKPRYADAVVFELWNILENECKDDILLSKWRREFGWFDQFRAEMYSGKYCHWSPEKIEEIKWSKLGKILTDCIRTPAHNWEKKIIDVFSGNIPGSTSGHVSITIYEEYV